MAKLTRILSIVGGGIRGLVPAKVLVAAPIKPNDRGLAIVVGLPFFVLGILFVRGWYRGRNVVV